MLVVCQIYISLSDSNAWSSLETIHTSTQKNKTALKITSLSSRWCVGPVYKWCLFCFRFTHHQLVLCYFHGPVRPVCHHHHHHQDLNRRGISQVSVGFVQKYLVQFKTRRRTERQLVKLLHFRTGGFFGPVYKTCLF